MPQQDHLRCSDRDRSSVEQLLNDAYTDGRLTREEHDERLNLVWAAKTFGELRTVTTDLVPATYSPSVARLTDVGGPVIGPSGSAPETGNIVAIFSSAKRDFAEGVPADNHVVGVFGEVKLDLTSATFKAPSCRLNLTVAMGEVTVRVPAGVRVRNEVSTILGETKLRGLVPEATGPELILTGCCIMGEVKVVGPENTSRFKKLLQELS
ncbi:MAG: DUF1707 domain-containing protein [Propionibacteriaceae bacterium]|nr:DUF1707 domain-containing protein [Propionibacteriaceae bacterium]